MNCRCVVPRSPLVAVCLLVGSCAMGQNSGNALQGFSPVQAMQIVDCLLPGQVRAVGGRTYLTQRRPTRTDAADCAARGGEFLIYDRADSSAAIAFWLPAAEAGDAEAQTTLGELYERGPSGTPDYAAAARWYQRAADQGYAPAQFSLGSLYEQGLGVAKNPLMALNLYREASGLSEDSLIFRSAAATAQEQLRQQLLEQIEQRDRRLDELNRQIEELNRELEETAEDSAGVRAELESARASLERIQQEQRADAEVLAGIPEFDASFTDEQSLDEPEEIEYRRRDFGRFYALIIGVQEYDLLEDVQTSTNDVNEIGRVLEERYGFSVIRLANPDEEAMVAAINRLSTTLREDDNLLIYFTGHGERLPSGAIEAGYWLPRNAHPSPNSTRWVSNYDVTLHLGRIAARRVLVIADSCYSGLLASEPGMVMVGDRRIDDEYIEWKMPKRSRLVLSSGDDTPIVANADEQHSVFASALLGTLNSNEQLLTSAELFLRVRQRIRLENGEASQDPELNSIKEARHEVGDFFLIPTQG